jgi:hypothetical protein
MKPIAAATQGVAAQRQPDSVAPGAILARTGLGALTPSAVVATRVVVIVAQAEEPDKPHDQQAHVEDAEADHEDPPLRGHAPMLARVGGGRKTNYA